MILAEEIEEQLYRAQKRWPKSSASRVELMRRQDAIAAALPALEDVGKGTPNWWDFWRRRGRAGVRVDR